MCFLFQFKKIREEGYQTLVKQPLFRKSFSKITFEFFVIRNTTSGISIGCSGWSNVLGHNDKPYVLKIITIFVQNEKMRKAAQTCARKLKRDAIMLEALAQASPQ